MRIVTKKKFTLSVMYGDADWSEDFSCITGNRDKIEFLTCFLETYDNDMRLACERPDLADALGGFSLAGVAQGADRICMAAEALLAQEGAGGSAGLFREMREGHGADAWKVGHMLKAIAALIHHEFGWDLAWNPGFAGIRHYGKPQGHAIEDVNIMAMTKTEAASLIKEKLGIGVVFVD